MTGQETAFGPELRRRRVAAGLSQAQLAARTHYTKGYLSKIETGHKPPGPDLARRCDAVLDAEGELSALVSRPPPAAEAEDGAGGETWHIRLAPDGECRFLPATGAADDTTPLYLGPGGKGMGAAVREDHAARALTAFRAQFDQARRLGQWAPPAAVLPTVITQTHTLRGLAAAAREPERGELLYLAARCAEFVGWMAQEASDDRAALWWTRESVRMAAPTGSTVLEAYSLVRRAEIALYHDDAVQVIELARRARARPGVPARIRGLAAQREAQGHALYGDHDGCRRTLDQAAELLAAPPADGPHEPVIGSSTVANLNVVVTAWCLHELGRSEDAADLLDREVPLIPATALRARLRFGARRALAHASAGEIDQACLLGAEILEQVDVVDSATIRTDLRRLARTLIRWQGQGSVRELYPRLIAALHTGAA
ncbi:MULTISPECIES: helix-turn-helix domain-containing protein [Actinomadura]|uniref:Helix-turn-helix domain-containing protein n=1 Tax=Actinomadura litoris TaxID=2678616 RepID=A0A7K1L2K2_9ACTN|nr:MULTISPECIES: helix-turn-helix transcriptional regulator [Actinomadura]MBT2208777.1 helix-turn-helix transcriptional regulator [Actinomadura sp. NEAU-AAG7]MUN38664.1 helix-turn-helix domain-containing protein [Actinomadura litoris]